MASSRTLGAIQGLGQGLNQVGGILMMDQLEKLRNERLMSLKETYTISAEQRAGTAAAATHARDRGEALEDAKTKREHEVGLQKIKASKHAKGYQFITQKDEFGNEAIRVGNKDTGLLDKLPPKVLTDDEIQTKVDAEYKDQANLLDSDEDQFGMSEKAWKKKRFAEYKADPTGNKPSASTSLDPKRVQAAQAILNKKAAPKTAKAGATGKEGPSRSQKREAGWAKQKATVAKIAKTDLSKLSQDQLTALYETLKKSAVGIAGSLSPEVRAQASRIMKARAALGDN